MANEIRSRSNFITGTLSVALAAGDTTISSAGIANLPAITSANHAVLVIEQEIVYVTAHTAAATTATILRAQEGTTAVGHALNVAWVHGPVVSDYYSVLGYQEVNASQGSITAAVDLTGLASTVTVPYAQHRVRITASCELSNNTADTVSAVTIFEGATQLKSFDVQVRLANNNAGVYAAVVVVPTAGTHTYKLRAVAGSGTATMIASATNTAYILVEDLGPAL